jgi:hypothetical protein
VFVEGMKAHQLFLPILFLKEDSSHQSCGPQLGAPLPFPTNELLFVTTAG